MTSRSLPDRRQFGKGRYTLPRAFTLELRGVSRNAGEPIKERASREPKIGLNDRMGLI